MSVFVDSVLTRNASFAFSTSNLSHGRAIFVRIFCPALPTKVTTVDWTRLNMLHTCSRAVNLQMSIPFDISIWAVVCNLWLQNLLAQCTFRTSKAYAVSSTILYSQKCQEHWNDFQWFQWFPQPHYSIQTHPDSRLKQFGTIQIQITRCQTSITMVCCKACCSPDSHLGVSVEAHTRLWFKCCYTTPGNTTTKQYNQLSS